MTKSRAMKFVGLVKKTSAKWQLRKDDQPGGRVMQITIEVEGAEVDLVAKNLLQFGAGEDLNVIIESRQLDVFQDNRGG